jgi:hypothetical protein
VPVNGPKTQAETLAQQECLHRQIDNVPNASNPLAPPVEVGIDVIGTLECEL